jgi:Kef-type K+ transport system membrane component KefB
MPAGRWVKLAAGYLLLLVAAALVFFAVRHLGTDLVAPAPSSGPTFGAGAAQGSATKVLPRVLLALVAILGASRVCGWLAERIGQPQVIGEVIAGICLGPSLLGRIAPEAVAFLFPPFVVQPLGVLAQVGVVLFLFLVGLALDTGILGRQSHRSVVISHASIIVPFVLGSVAALWVYPSFSSSQVPFDVFAMFMGVSMSVTAFPVLARILTDRGMQKTTLGTIALSCAAVDDVSAWCLLAVVAGFATRHADGALPTVGLTVVYVLVMIFAVRPVVRRVSQRLELVPNLSKAAVTLVFIALLLSALATEWIGIHALFGAFLLGAIVPHDSRLARELAAKLEDVTVLLFLPAFFAHTGLRTQIGLVQGAGAWLVCGALILVACAGKFGGGAVAGRLCGMSWRDSISVGILMNTRGLMELVVLNVGLDLGVLSPTLFTMLVIMALVTTFMTAPALSLVERRRSVDGAASSTAR